MADPSLTSQLGGIVLHDLTWRGRHFGIAIAPRSTTVTLTQGLAMVIDTPSGRRVVRVGTPLRIATRRPDRRPTSDVVRCSAASASSSALGAPPLAAVDGSPVTDWQPTSLPDTLTAPIVHGLQTVTKATLRWGQQWPPSPAPNVPPPPGPVTTLRASSYTLQISHNGHSWQTVATVTSKTSGTLDVLHFRAVRAREVRVVITSATAGQPPMLEEVTVS